MRNKRVLIITILAIVLSLGNSQITADNTVDCLALDANCATCDRTVATKCSLCKQGFQIVQDKVSSKIYCIRPDECRYARCSTCAKVTTNRDGQTLLIPQISCAQCDAGYRLVMDRCFPLSCIYTDKGCLTCVSDSQCGTCRPGFQLKEGACTPITDISLSCSEIAGCVGCTNSSPPQCVRCGPLYISDYMGGCKKIESTCKSEEFLNEKTKTCELCHKDCLGCFGTQTNCISCKIGRVPNAPHCSCPKGEHVDETGVCEKTCDFEFFVDDSLMGSPQVNYQSKPCSRCDSKIQSCKSCSGPEHCLACHDGFQLGEAGQSCVQISSSEVANANTKCMSFPNTSFVPINLNDLTNGECLPCAKGCEACAFDLTYISKCSKCTDSTLTPNEANKFTCRPAQPVIENCSEYKFIEKWECATCVEGFYPEGTICIKKCEKTNQYFDRNTVTCVDCNIQNCSICYQDMETKSVRCSVCADNFAYNREKSTCDSVGNSGTPCSEKQMRVLNEKTNSYQCKDCTPGCQNGCQETQINYPLLPMLSGMAVPECIKVSGQPTFCLTGFKEETTLFDKCVPNDVDVKSVLECTSGVSMLTQTCTTCDDANCDKCRPEKFCLQCKSGFQTQMGICVGKKLECTERFRNCLQCTETQCTACQGGITISADGMCVRQLNQNVECDPSTNKFLQTIRINGVDYKDCVKCPSRCLNGCQELSPGGQIECNSCRPGFRKNAVTKHCDSMCGEGPFAVQVVASATEGAVAGAADGIAAGADGTTTSTTTPTTDIEERVICKKCPTGCGNCNLATSVDEPICDACMAGYLLKDGRCLEVLRTLTDVVSQSACPKFAIFNLNTQRCECDRSLQMFLNEKTQICEKNAQFTEASATSRRATLGQFIDPNGNEKDCVSINPDSNAGEVGQCATCSAEQCFSCMPGFVLVNQSCLQCPRDCDECVYDFNSNKSACKVCSPGSLLSVKPVYRETVCANLCQSGYLINIDSYFQLNREDLDQFTKTAIDQFRDQLANGLSTVAAATSIAADSTVTTFDDKYASDIAQAERADCQPMAVTNSGRVVCQSDLNQLPFQLEKDGAWNLKQTAKVRLNCTPCLQNCRECPDDLIQLGNRCTISCTQGLKETQNTDGRRICLPIEDTDAFTVEMKSRQPFRYRGWNINSINEDLVVELNHHMGDAAKITVNVLALKKAGQGNEISEVHEDQLEGLNDEVEIRSQFLSGFALKDRGNKVLVVPYNKLTADVVYKIEVVAQVDNNEKQVDFQFVALNINARLKFSDIAQVEINNDGALGQLEGEAAKTRFRVVVQTDFTKVGLEDDFSAHYTISPLYVVQAAARFRLSGEWKRRSEFNFNFVIPYSSVDLTAVLTISVMIRNAVYTQEFFLMMTKSTTEVDPVNDPNLKIIRDLPAAGQPLPSELNTRMINEQLNKIKAKILQLKGETVQQAGTALDAVSQQQTSLERQKRKVVCQVGDKSAVPDVELRCYDNGECVARLEGDRSQGGVCACKEGFSSDLRCRISNEQSKKLEPFFDALKSVLAGAARIASEPSSATAPLTESQTQEMLTTLQQVTDINLTEQPVFNNILVVLEKIAENANLPNPDVTTAVKIVEFLKNQVNQNQNQLFANQKELDALSESEATTVKMEKSQIEQQLLRLTRKLNLLLATSLINDKKDQVVRTDDTATKISQIETATLSDQQTIEITIPSIEDGDAASLPPGSAVIDSTTPAAQSVNRNIKVPGSQLNQLIQLTSAKDICFRMTTTAQDFQSTVRASSQFLDFAIYKDCAPGQTPTLLDVQDLVEPIKIVLVPDNDQATKCAYLKENSQGLSTLVTDNLTWDKEQNECATPHLTSFALVSDEDVSGDTTPQPSGSATGPSDSGSTTQTPIVTQSQETPSAIHSTLLTITVTVLTFILASFSLL